jgi:dethiobiotin synthetase
MPQWWSAWVRDLLVTGTDTGVGKTVVAAALVTALRAQGVRALGFKPAQSGRQLGQLSDADVLAAASGEHNPLALPLLDLAEPLAPAVAAEREGVRVSASNIEARIDSLRRAGYTLVIEGAGGVMVPILWNYTVLDMAEHFNLDAVVVARAGLGTLNHIMLTAAMLQSRNIPIRAVVLNGRKNPPDLAETTNPSVLARMLAGVTIIEVPHQPSATIQEVISATIAKIRSVRFCETS